MCVFTFDDILVSNYGRYIQINAYIELFTEKI